MAIAIVLTVLAVITLTSRTRLANLESAAQTVMSDLSSARSGALLKGCPIRLVMCTDRKCTPGSGGVPPTNVVKTTKYISNSSGATQIYAFYRMSSTTSGNPCYNPNAIAATSDGYANWDFDRRPQEIPQGVAFSAIYDGNSGVPDNSDWSSTVTSAAAANSLWFDSTTGQLNNGGSTPITSGNYIDGNGTHYKVVVQLTLATCDPSSTSTSDCVGYFIAESAGGQFTMVKCLPGGRTDNNNTCF